MPHDRRSMCSLQYHGNPWLWSAPKVLLWIDSRFGFYFNIHIANYRLHAAFW
jgi:hypothetical protein